MDLVKSKFASLEKLVRGNTKPDDALQKGLTELSTISGLLACISATSITPQTANRLSKLFRQTLRLFYPKFLLHALALALNIVKYIHDDRISKPSHKENASIYQGLLASIISGILDFMEEQQDAKTQAAVANQAYPIICPLYVEEGAALDLWVLDRGFAVTICQLLNAITMGNGTTANQLRQRIGSSRLGEIISKVRDFLLLEAALMLFGYLTPPLKKGREPRSAFIKDVFEPKRFPLHDRITSLAESSAPDRWDVTLTKIVAVLAEMDVLSSFFAGRPQPFEVQKIQIGEESMQLEPPFYCDNKGFSGNYELPDGALDTLEIPFSALKPIRCNIEKFSALVNIELLRPIDIGDKKLENGTSISFSIPVASLSHFIKVSRQRNVKIGFGNNRFSTAGKEINLDIPLVKEDSKVLSEQRIEHFSQTHLQSSSSPSLEYVESPCKPVVDNSTSPTKDRSPTTSEYKSILPLPTSPVSITSDDDEPAPIKPPPRGFKNRAIVVSDDEEELPKKILTPDKAPGLQNTSTDVSPKKRTTRSTTARARQIAPKTAPAKRKRVVDSEDEELSASDVELEERTTSSPSKRAPLKTYKKKAKTVPVKVDKPLKTSVNFDELPKTKKAPLKKPPAKAQPPAKPKRGKQVAKVEPLDAQRVSKKVVEETTVVDETTVWEDVAEDEGPTLIDLNDMMPAHAEKPEKRTEKQVPAKTDLLPRKNIKPRKAPWEDMDTDILRAPPEPRGMDVVNLSPLFSDAHESLFNDFEPPCSSSTDTEDFPVAAAASNPVPTTPPKKSSVALANSSVHLKPVSPEKSAAKDSPVFSPVRLPDVKPKTSTAMDDDQLPQREPIKTTASEYKQERHADYSKADEKTLGKAIAMSMIKVERPPPLDSYDRKMLDKPEPIVWEMRPSKVNNTDVFSDALEPARGHPRPLRAPTNSHPSRRTIHDSEASRMSCDEPEQRRSNSNSVHQREDFSSLNSFRRTRRESETDTKKPSRDVHNWKARQARSGHQKAVPDPMESIVEVLNELNEALVDKIQGRFDSVTSNLQISQQAAVQNVVDLLTQMQNDRWF
ncbi:hypothetical protein CVT24_006731 [Panaeolus cyanescens]|uniref:Uncharacterized protein n=1 Tax=Panaeolus cyanescens TaxID=181874 RepID=A0A409V9H5_9AGAR|nr:hypothetical protein CVT24_006731 [Panaeolus cyanescens]